MSGLVRLAAGVMFVALSGGSSAGAGQAAAPPPGRWAVIIGDDRPEVVSEQRAAAGALRDRYGYSADRMLELYGREATRANIRERLSSLSKRMRPTDSLFAYVLLRTVEDRKGAEYFVPTDGREEEVWTLIGRDEVEEAVAGLPILTSLAIINACTDGADFVGSKAWTMQSSMLRGGGRASTLRFCERTATDLGARRFAESFTEMLTSSGTNDRLADAEIDTRLRESLRGMQIELKRPGRYIDDGFEFVIERRRADMLLDMLASAPTPVEQVRAVDALLRLLRSSPDGATQDIIVRGIAGLARNQAAPRVARMRAIGALGETGLPAAIRDLTAISGPGTPAVPGNPGTDDEFRRAALTALARIGTAETLPPLLSALKDTSAPVRVAAVRGAGNHKHLTSAAPIVAAVSDPNPEVQVAALQILAILAKPQQAGRNLIAPVAAAAKKSAQRALADPSAEVRREAVNTLARLGVDLARDPAALGLLTNDADPTVRKTVALTLGREYRGVWESTSGTDDGRYKLNEQRAPALAGLIRAAAVPASADVRAAAIWSLGEIADPRGEQVLMRGLLDQDSEPRVREAAVEALGKMRHRPAIPGIVPRLGDESPRMRAAAARALGLIRDPAAARPLLTQLASEKDVYVRQAIEDALHRLPTPSMQAIAAALDAKSPKVRREAIERLREIPDPEAAQFALDAFADPDEDVRQEALKVLISQAGAWFDSLEVASESDMASARLGVAVAFGELGTPAAGRVLLTRIGREQNPAVKAAIVEALGSITPPTDKIETALLGAALDPDPFLRAVAATSLRRYPSTRVRETLLALAEDDEPAVRQNAIASLRLIVK